MECAGPGAELENKRGDSGEEITLVLLPVVPEVEEGGHQS